MELKEVLVLANSGLPPNRELLFVSVVGEEKLNTAVVTAGCCDEELTAASETDCSLAAFAVEKLNILGFSLVVVVANKFVGFVFANTPLFGSGFSGTLLGKLEATLLPEKKFVDPNKPSDTLLLKAVGAVVAETLLDVVAVELTSLVAFPKENTPFGLLGTVLKACNGEPENKPGPVFSNINPEA